MSQRKPSPERPHLFNPGADSRARTSADEELGIARCPRCNQPLVARMRRGGPFFYCGCRSKKAA